MSWSWWLSVWVAMCRVGRGFLVWVWVWVSVLVCVG